METTVAIADITFSIHYPDVFSPVFINYFKQFSDKKQTSSTAKFFIELPDNCVVSSLPDHQMELHCRSVTPDTFIYECSLFKLITSLENCEGHLVFASGKTVDYSIVYNAFKWFFIFMVIAQKGVPLHSSLISHNHSGFLFSGPSGRGKSTIAQLITSYLPDFLCESDEVNIIYLRNCKPVVYTTPYYSSNHSGSNADRSTLSNVFFLEQALFHKVKYVSRESAMKHLLYNIYHIPGNRELSECLMDTIAQLSVLPMFNLFLFKNDPSVATFFKQYLKGVTWV